MSGYALVVTFVVSGFGTTLTITDGGSDGWPSNHAVYHVPQPTDYAVTVAVPCASMDEAKAKAATAAPPGIGVGYKTGPVLVIELATGKVTRLRLTPKFVTKTETRTVQEGFVAEVEP